MDLKKPVDNGLNAQNPFGSNVVVDTTNTETVSDREVADYTTAEKPVAKIVGSTEIPGQDVWAQGHGGQDLDEPIDFSAVGHEGDAVLNRLETAEPSRISPGPASTVDEQIDAMQASVEDNARVLRLHVLNAVNESFQGLRSGMPLDPTICKQKAANIVGLLDFVQAVNLALEMPEPGYSNAASSPQSYANTKEIKKLAKRVSKMGKESKTTLNYLDLLSRGMKTILDNQKQQKGHVSDLTVPNTQAFDAIE